MITKEKIIQIYEDNGFLLNLIGEHYHISNPFWNLPDKNDAQYIQDKLMSTHRVLSLTLEEMLIKLLENKMIKI